MHLLSRNNNPLAPSFPELAALGELLGGRECVLDGEIVCLVDGRPDFGALQKRMHLQRPSQHLLARLPATYIAFDLLELDGDDLTGLDYRTRRGLLASLGLSSGVVQVPPHYEDLSIAQLLDTAEQHGLEGVLAKRLASQYRPGRSPEWIKIPLRRACDAVIGGWQPGRRSLSGTVGALLLGAHTEDHRLAFLGHVASGLTRAHRAALDEGLPPLETPECPFTPPPPVEHARGARWVQPLVVVEVNYRELTRDGRLRAPSWRGIRTDIDADQVVPPQR